MSSKRLRVTAKVAVTIEVSGVGSWNKEVTAEQVYAQAVEEAIGQINKAFESRPIQIIGKPVPKMVMAEEV